MTSFEAPVVNFSCSPRFRRFFPPTLGDYILNIVSTAISPILVQVQLWVWLAQSSFQSSRTDWVCQKPRCVEVSSRLHSYPYLSPHSSCPALPGICWARTRTKAYQSGVRPQQWPQMCVICPLMPVQGPMSVVKECWTVGLMTTMISISPLLLCSRLESYSLEQVRKMLHWNL